MDRRERLLLENRDRVFRLALRLTGGCHAEAEDLAQEALVVALTRLPLFLGKAKLTTWLYTITVRTGRDRARRRQIETLPLLDSDAAAPDPMALPLLRLDLDAAIRALPEPQREAFVLVKAEGLTFREAARILDAPQGTVQWRVHDACARLRQLLEEPR